MAGEPPNREEIEKFVADWFRMLDEHVPAAKILRMVSNEIEFRPPEGVQDFREWYERVIRRFFDELHTVRSVQVSWAQGRALVDVVVNWQARRWPQPKPRSQWITKAGK